ncbi:MAG: glutaredoxin domain-containing protein [Candidatus Promineifilaceae bacterium]|nr:glutaredoxin domain-containing protein [Candidatus Promineifilaceae bacterium]
MDNQDEKITLYTSRFCGHSLSVEHLLREYGIPAEIVNIDGDAEANARLLELNDGYASVPTLLFPDGTQMTEPSLRRLREKLGIEEASLIDRALGLIVGGRD